MPHVAPGEVELAVFYRIHLGGRFRAAGLQIQFHYNQQPGIHFKVSVPAEYQDAIIKGIEKGLAFRFPAFPKTASVWITGITIDDVDSSWRDCYRVAQMSIDQAFLLAESGHEQCST